MILVTEIPLYPDPAFTQSVTLDQISFQMRFYVNTRTALYHFDLFDAVENPVALGIALLPYTKLCELPSLSQYGLHGYFVMMPINSNTIFEEVPVSAIWEKYGLLYISEPTV